MKRSTIPRRLRAFHEDQRGEVTTQQMLYLAIGAIVAAILYKFGGRLLAYVKKFLDDAESGKMQQDAGVE
jgi:hypothetical protein